MSNGVTPAQFIAKWAPVELSEPAASQSHFNDLCRLLGQPNPTDYDPTGEEYCFAKGVAVTGPASAGSKGESGFADVWWRRKFGWEYKRKSKYKDLAEAYRQLCQYREALENPPLLIVSDIARTEIHTNFTNTPTVVHTVLLDELVQPGKLDLLRRVFTEPESFKPGLTTWTLTENAAAEFAKISDALRERKHDPHEAAHFLMKCMFCLFAEDVKLLPEKLFSKLLARGKSDPDKLTGRLTELFHTMGRGGDFGSDPILWFNGGLFDDAPALPLRSADVHAMLITAQFDWGAVEPAIFGTLFERSLDPSKRAQIGAHYTSREDIKEIVEPVVMAPLLREWTEVQAQVEKLLARRRAAADKAARTRADKTIAKVIEAFHHRLATVRILDPACGSGNFLYVAIQQLLTLEKEVIVYAGRPEIGSGYFPRVRPTQLHGIEIKPYAAELAQVVIWIGYLQWMRENGYVAPRDPILAKLQTIDCRDAILDLTIPTKPQPATWPEADFIIGNPPFLGSKQFRQNGLDDGYVQAMYDAYDLPKTSDLCCYWFEQARRAVGRSAGAAAFRPRGRNSARRERRGSDSARHECRGSVRVGLLATQGIRGGDNRTVLERIKGTGDIFMAWSDREWILDGAAVHVSMIGFDDGTETDRALDGHPAGHVNADLTADVPTVGAAPIERNAGIAFMGVTPSGGFEVEWSKARAWLAVPNPHGVSNGEVLRPWVNALDLMRRDSGTWIVDFGTGVDEAQAAQFEAPFEHVVKVVAPARAKYRTGKRGYWCFERPRPEMRAALASHGRFLATPLVAKHRAFAWLQARTLAANLVIVFARSDNYFFGVLHSSIHELWALRMGTQLEDRPRYTPTTCFETFPLPWPPGQEPVAGAPGSDLHARIAGAARELNEQREHWLNPPAWIEDWGRLIDARDKFEDVPAEARPLLRHSAVMAEAARDPRFKKRTLTHLYNERPTWLKLAHEKLDRAVLAAYAGVDPEGGWSEDWATVWTETGAGQPPPEPAADASPADRGVAADLAARRKQIDQRVLANLLRLNLARAGR